MLKISIGKYRIEKKDLEQLQEDLADKIFNAWMSRDHSSDAVPPPVQIPILDALSKPANLRNAEDEQLIEDTRRSRVVTIVCDGPEDDLKDLKDEIEDY